MPPPRSIEAYQDCQEYWEKALDTPRGLGLTLETQGQATRFRMRMNMLRDKLRKQSRDIFPEGDPRHGRTPFDGLEVRADPENAKRVLIRPVATNVTKEEEL